MSATWRRALAASSRVSSHVAAFSGARPSTALEKTSCRPSETQDRADRRRSAAIHRVLLACSPKDQRAPCRSVDRLPECSSCEGSRRQQDTEGIELCGEPAKDDYPLPDRARASSLPKQTCGRCRNSDPETTSGTFDRSANAGTNNPASTHTSAPSGCRSSEVPRSYSRVYTANAWLQRPRSHALSAVSSLAKRCRPTPASFSPTSALAAELAFDPKQGDCCVFCSYSDQRCPPKQS